MQTRDLILSLAVVLLLVSAPRAFAQLDTHPLSPLRTLGYFNSDTGLFEPLRTMAQEGELGCTPGLRHRVKGVVAVH